MPWTAQSGGVHGRVLGFATNHVVADGTRLYAYGSLADLQALAAGAPGGFYFDGTTLSVKFADGSAPAGHVMNVARLEEGFVLDGRSHVRVEDLEIRHYGSGAFGKGVYLRQSSDCAVRGLKIHHVGSVGVWVKGGSRNLVEGNEVWDTGIFGWKWDLVKGSSAETTGISVTDNPGRGNVIRGNTLHGTFNGMAPCGDAAPSSGEVTCETDVYDNVLGQHLDDALEPEGHCSNVRIWGNRIQDVHMAFAVAPAAVGPMYIVRNVAWRHGNTRASQLDGWVSSALKINSGLSAPIGPLFLYHNTVLTDAPGTDAVALLSGGSSAGIRARNNLLAGTRYALYKTHGVALDWDGDDLFTTDPSRFVRWTSGSFASLAAFQAGTGQEAHGISADPRLEDPAAGDFRPALDSPLLDAGRVLPGINDGFTGAAPDVGAFERGDGPPLPTLSIGDVQVTEGNSGTVSAVFTLTLSQASPQTVTVQYATAPGTAMAGTDYTTASGTVSFPAGTTTRTVPVAVRGDTENEPDETFLVDLSGEVGAVLGDGQGRGTILDDDAAPLPVLGVGDASVTEGDAGTVNATFTVSLSAAGTQAVTVAYATANGTATAGSDYTAASGVLTFAPGVTSRTVSVAVRGDFLAEAAETLLLNLSGASGAAIGDGQGLGTIVDDDANPKMISPVPGSVLPGATATFSWSAGAGVTQFRLRVGTTPGGAQVWSGRLGLATSRTVTRIPTGGRPIYVRLRWLKGGSWSEADYTYQAAP